MNNSKLKKGISVLVAFAMVFTMFAFVMPIATSAASTEVAPNLKDCYDVQLVASYDGYEGIFWDGGDIDHNVLVKIDGKNNNCTAYFTSNIYSEEKEFYAKDSTWIHSIIKVDHPIDETATFPTMVTGRVNDWQNWSGLNKESIDYVLTIEGTSYNFNLKYDEFNKDYTYYVPVSDYPYIDSAYISLDKHEVTVGAKDQKINATAVFGDQYGVKWTGTTDAKYEIVGNVPGVSVDNKGVVTITDAAANATGADRTFQVKVTAGKAKSATSDPVTIKTPSYAATFKYGNDTLGTVSYVYGAKTLDATKAAKIALPTETGCNFAWSSYTLNNDNNTVVEAIRNPITYYATFKADGVQVGQPIAFTVDTKDTVVAPVVPDKEGYDSHGWEAYTLGASDIVINANPYTIKQYEATFKYGDQELGKVVYNHGATTLDTTTVALPTEDGCTFAWSPYTLNNDNNTVVNAIRTAVDYKVTFFDEDGAIVDDTLTYNVDTKALSAAEPIVPEKTGYTGAWEAYNLTSIGDVEVKPIYTINTYTVDFVVDGTTVDTQTVDYGTGATAPTVADKAGFTFDGWDVDFSNVTGDLTVNAKWTENPVIVEDETPLASVPTKDDSTAYSVKPEVVEIKDETPLASAANTEDTANIAVWGVVCGTALAGTVVLKKKYEND